MISSEPERVRLKQRDAEWIAAWLTRRRSEVATKQAGEYWSVVLVDGGMEIRFWDQFWELVRKRARGVR